MDTENRLKQSSSYIQVVFPEFLKIQGIMASQLMETIK